MKALFPNFFRPQDSTGLLLSQQMIAVVKRKCGELRTSDDLERILATKNKYLRGSAVDRMIPAMFECVKESLVKTVNMETRRPQRQPPPSEVPSGVPNCLGSKQ